MQVWQCDSNKLSLIKFRKMGLFQYVVWEMFLEMDCWGELVIVVEDLMG